MTPDEPGRARCDHKASEFCQTCYPWRQSTLGYAEMLHAEAHPGVFVPTLETCDEHDALAFIRRALALEPSS